MLINQPKARIVERIIRDRHGELLRAYFLVAEFEGRIFWKVLRVEPMMAHDFGAPKSRAALPCRPRTIFVKRVEPKPKPTASPYFSPADFLVAQMPRAPSYAELTQK